MTRIVWTGKHYRMYLCAMGPKERVHIQSLHNSSFPLCWTIESAKTLMDSIFQGLTFFGVDI